MQAYLIMCLITNPESLISQAPDGFERLVVIRMPRVCILAWNFFSFSLILWLLGRSCFVSIGPGFESYAQLRLLIQAKGLYVSNLAVKG